MSFDGTPRERATHLLAFADGFEEAGYCGLARQSRVVARDVLRLADELDSERAARRGIQTQRDDALEILATHAARALA